MGGLVSPAPLGSALGGCVGYRGAPRGCRVAASGPASRGAAPAAELRLRRRRRPGSCGDTREQVPHPPLRGPRPVLEAGRGPRPFLGLHRSETVGKDEWSRSARFCGVRGRACVTAVGVSPRCFRNLYTKLMALELRTPRTREILKELDEYYEKFKRETDGVQKRRVLHCIQRALIRSQELGDEKIQIVSQMVELVENRTRQVDSHVELFEAHQEANDTTGHSGKAGQDKSKSETITQAEKTNNKRSRRQRNNENRENAANNHDHDDITSGTPKEKKAKASKKKKRSKAKAEREASPADLPIDPNEPTYCLCNQVSYGEMIGCDNDECPIEWFHFSCVGLNHKPKGKWYCPKCRGENEKTMDKALEKSKKERAYNR
ncbi:inhibitor of growth protein 1 isoform X1 [Meles meles]|uniref:inhibitor of growth protein 1 isoform X1 n=2 Tax=Meles meles TaxID=9662 RepID=UPI001E69D577|nr:inhibitor of growth protein 1 isoform X1 [Meles meles]